MIAREWVSASPIVAILVLAGLVYGFLSGNVWFMWGFLLFGIVMSAVWAAFRKRSVDKPYGLRAKCPACEEIFIVEFAPGSPLQAATPEIARSLIDSLKKQDEMTYVFSKARGKEEEAIVPTDLTCSNCGAVHRRVDLAYHPYDVRADTTDVEADTAE